MEITKELILKNFENNVTPLQRKHIDLWLQEQENEEKYYQWLEEWENHNPEYVPDSPGLIAGYVSYMHDNTAEGASAEDELDADHSKAWFVTSGPIAAMILMLMVASGIFIFKSQAILYIEHRTETGQSKNIALQDGTRIYLQSASTLWVPRWKVWSNKREVLLEGEARFSVAHTDDSKRFVVKTAKDFEVVVLGTEFTVSAHATHANVALIKGKVRLNYRENKKSKHLMMNPGERVSLDESNRLTLTVDRKKYPYSLEEPRHFVFENITLSEFAHTLELDYGFTVQIESQEIAKRKLMGSFMAQNLDEVLNTIGILLDVVVVRKEGYITFSRKP